MLKETSVLAKGSKTQLAPGTSAGPSHASRDGAETCLCQNACHNSPVTERQALRASDGKKVEGNFFFFFFKAGLKRFFYNMGYPPPHLPKNSTKNPVLSPLFFNPNIKFLYVFLRQRLTSTESWIALSLSKYSRRH